MSGMNGNFFRFLALEIFFFLSASSLGFSTDMKLTFLRHFVAHRDFYSPAYNVLFCQESDVLNVVKSFSENVQKFATVHAMDRELRSFDEEPQCFILDLHCSQSAQILKQAENLSIFRKPFKWLLLTSRPDEGKNFTGNKTIWSGVNLEGLRILVDSDVKVAERVDNDKITITGVYKLQRGLIEERLGEWTSEKGFTIFNSKVAAIRRWNLQGTNIVTSLAASRRSTLDHLEDLVDKHIDVPTKVAYNVVNLYGDLFNISVTRIFTNEWGEKINGSWIGVVGDVNKGKAEFGSSSVFFRPDRASAVEFYAMVTPSEFKFIFLSPPISYSKNIFLMPFDAIVWGCCIGVIVTSCFLLFTALKFEKAGEKQSRDISFSEILILNIGAICLQGTVAQTRKPPGRIITLFVYLTYMFLYISYSAAIVAILQSSDTSVQSLTDFLKSPLKAGVNDAGYNKYYFEGAEDEVRKAIYRTKIAPNPKSPNYLPVEEGIKKLRQGFYAYHVDLTTGYQVIQNTFTEEEKCALQELKGAFIRYSHPWIFMRQKSIYQELFKIGIKRCIERGFKSRFVRRYYTKKPVCAPKSSRFYNVGMMNCYHAFVMLFAGTALAVAIAILEISFSVAASFDDSRENKNGHN